MFYFLFITIPGKVTAIFNCKHLENSWKILSVETSPERLRSRVLVRICDLRGFDTGKCLKICTDESLIQRRRVALLAYELVIRASIRNTD